MAIRQGVFWSWLIATTMATAQTDERIPGQPAVTLGMPLPLGGTRITSFDDRPGTLELDGTTTVEHRTLQIGTLPPPTGEELPVPDFARLDQGPPASQFSRPLHVHYTLIGRAGVDGPATAVKMNQIGVNYQMRFAGAGRFSWGVKPFFDVLFLSGPVSEDPILPAQLYKVGADVQADYAFNEQWGIAGGISPGFWTDFASLSGDDIRIPTRLMVTYRPMNNLRLVGGLIYTDNFRNNLLPFIGGSWDVTDRWTVELLGPRFRAIYKLHEELQFYGAFERGGDTYNLRTRGQDEDFEYRDFRVMLGTQVDIWQPASLFAEVGFAFDRRFRFEIQTERNINTAFVLRAGARF